MERLTLHRPAGRPEIPEREVSFLCKTLPHYRVAFFEQLRDCLADEGIVLRLIYGQPDSMSALRADTCHLSWAEPVRNRYFRVGSRQLVWQPCLRSVRNSELVVVEQASKLLVNYGLLLWKSFGGPRVAWWGHGINLNQESSSRLGETVKRYLVSEADWWFCYTEATSDLVRSLGVPTSRMTVVQNTTDTGEIQRSRIQIVEGHLSATRSVLGLGGGSVGLYLGSLYKGKRLAYLISAADRVRELVPDFELIIIGDGPDRGFVDDKASVRPWLHVLGTRMGAEMVEYAALADLVLNPGVVGLSVLDSFALGLPLVTVEQDGHGPEIEYLVDGENGVVLSYGTTTREFGNEIASLLGDPELLKTLGTHARESAGRYTTTEMVRRFTQGILAALSEASA